LNEGEKKANLFSNKELPEKNIEILKDRYSQYKTCKEL
jgi:hypothetical protein